MGAAQQFGIREHHGGVTPSPKSRDAIAAGPDLRVFDFQFDRELSRMLSLLLSGIEHRTPAMA